MMPMCPANMGTWTFVGAALLAAMAAGRLVWAAATFLLTGSLTLQAFLAGALLTAWPGIVLQLVLVPALVLALRRARLME